MVSSQASCSAVSRMTSLEVSVFCEDRAHEEFVGPFVNRVAAEESCAVHISMRVARGGIGRALSEFRIFQKLVAVLQEPAPDITVVAIDANCKGFATKRKEIASAVRDDYLGGQIVTACPDPHVERWYVADPASCTQVFGAQPRIGKVKCSRGYDKRVLPTLCAKVARSRLWVVLSLPERWWQRWTSIVLVATIRHFVPSRTSFAPPCEPSETSYSL